MSYRRSYFRMSPNKACQNSILKKLAARRRVLDMAAGYACERLEKRRLLANTLTGGGEVNGVPQEGTPFEYLDGAKQDVRIALMGNITAVFSFAQVDGDNDMTLGDAVPAPAPSATVPTFGADLYHIDVISASPNASISIAEVPGTSTDPTVKRPMNPFGSPDFSITTFNAITGVGPVILTPDPGTGQILLGALAYGTPSTTGPQNAGSNRTIPILDIDGVTPGLETATGVSMNRFFFGGTVTGRVDLGGSIDTFYAGQILTGDDDGLLLGESPDSSLSHNFNVAGDIDNLISKGAIGTTSGTDATLGQETYTTGFRLSVTGHIGEIESRGSIIGSTLVVDSPNFKGLGTTQYEEEGNAPATEVGDASAFEGDGNADQIDSGVPTLAGDEADFGNGRTATDSATTNGFYNAQLLGTIFSSEYGHGSIQLEGALDGAANVNDYYDTYGVALIGGQTVDVNVSPTNSADFGSLAFGIYSPDALSTKTGLIASSFDPVNSLRESGQTIQITASEPGIYYIVVAFAADPTLLGDPSLIPLYEIDYNLVVTGVKDMAIGGMKAVQDIDFPGIVDPASGLTIASLTAENGDIGAILATGNIAGGDASEEVPDAVNAALGNLRVMQAGGDIGGSQAITGAGSTGVTRIGQFLSPTLAAGKDVGLVQSGGLLQANAQGISAIGGSYELFDAGTIFSTNFRADKGVGTIRAQSVGTANFPLVWSVNADDKGSDGIIDLIDVTGDGSGAAISGNFGTMATGGPEITTGPGGNVRYMHIAPTVEVFNDAFFGGNEDDVIHYAQGAAATITDDSGTPVTFYPSKARANIPGDITATTSTATGTTTSTSTGSSTSSISAGTLSALTYGIEDKGGVVIINMTETAGDIDVTTASTTTTGTTSTTTIAPVVSAEDAPVSLSISTSAAGTNGSADIGTLNMVGAGEISTFDPDTQKFTVTNGTKFTQPEDMSVSMTGKSPINVWSLVGSEAPMVVNEPTASLTTGGGTGTTIGYNDNTPELAGMNTVSNATSGEIVNFTAEDVASLSAQTLGISHGHTTASVQGAVLYNAYPFHNQRTLIQVGGAIGVPADPGVGGNAQSISARGALGNIVVDGNLGSLSANTAGVKTAGVVNGIDGPVAVLVGTGSSVIQQTVTNTTTGTTTTTPVPSTISGNIISVNIGQGLGYSGTGDFAATGIFAANAIETVTNQGAGSDIRGDIVASGLNGGLPVLTVISPITGLPEPTNPKAVHGLVINSINLTGGGSLIGARIMVVSQFNQAIVTSGVQYIEFNLGNEGAATLFNVGSINLSGNGGMIGSQIVAGGVGSISIPDGFGMINSELDSLNGDQIGSITLGGYGMRSDVLTGQNSVGSITLTGNGKEIPVTAFTASVRQSELGGTVDAFSQQPLDASNDLDLFLAVTRAKPKRTGSTEAGVIADTSITGTDRLGSLTAFRMIGHKSTSNTLAAEREPLEPMDLDFAQSIGKIKIKENATRVHITTGGLTAFDTGGQDVSVNISTSGNIADLTAGSINSTTHINATGPDGTITYLKTTLGMAGDVAAAVSIGTLSVGTDLTSTAIDSSGTFSELQVKGSILSGAAVRVARTLGTLNVKHSILSGASVSAKAIKKQIIGGQVFGNIVITG